MRNGVRLTIMSGGPSSAVEASLDYAADHMFDREMGLLDLLRIARWNGDGHIGQRGEDAGRAGEGDHRQSELPRGLRRGEHIARVAAGADGQQDVAGAAVRAD